MGRGDRVRRIRRGEARFAGVSRALTLTEPLDGRRLVKIVDETLAGAVR